MTNAAIIRCEKNEERCPLTNCFKCLREGKEGFAGTDNYRLAGVFTCRCPGDNAVSLGKILKAKGADVIHFCTCTFARKTDDGWELGKGGFCDQLDNVIEAVHNETGLPCVKGTAHLPKGYTPQTWGNL